MLRKLTIAASCGAILLAPALPAAAAPAATYPTFIENFASSVSTVAYQQPVTFTGELVETSAKTPVPNELVQIQLEQPGEGQFAAVATGTTGADGTFTITATLPSGGDVRAAFAGDTGLGPSYSAPESGLLLRASQLPSRLVLNPVPASVPAGTSETFSGTLQVQVSGTWEPFQGAPLTLTMEPYTSSQPNLTYPTTSGADGQFSLTEPVTETSNWIVNTTLNGDYWGDEWFPDYATADYNWIKGVSKTQIVGFHIPVSDTAQAALSEGLYATGIVNRWNGSSWVGLAYGLVQLYYRPKGSRTWHKDDSTQTGPTGNFKVAVGIHVGTSEWHARVEPADDTLTSTSATLTNTMTDRTHLVGVRIQRSSLGDWLEGQVTDMYRNTTFASMRGLKVRLYYRARGSKTWHYYKGAVTDLYGYFSFHGAKGYGYLFRVKFPAQRALDSCTSRTL
jgi:hypothetical protein